MRILNTAINLEEFYKKLKEYSSKALLLDYDGTLAPFKIDPGKAYPYPGVQKILNSVLKNKSTRMVIISGRYTKDLIPLLGLQKTPEIWGSHGLERLRPNGTYEVALINDRALKGLALAHSGVHGTELAHQCEQKPGCFALHWRGMEKKKIAKIKKNIKQEWLDIAREYDLQLRKFDGGFELRVSGKDKGDAVRTVLSEMNSHTIAAYLGDDLTDEDGFRAVRKHGIGALVRSKFRPTAADIWLQPPDDLLDFLSYFV